MADAQWVQRSPSQEKLAQELRAARLRAGVKTTKLSKPTGGFYRSSTISRIETNKAAASEGLLKAYIGIGGDEQFFRFLYESAQVERELILRPPRRASARKAANFYKVLSRVESHWINEQGATRGTAVDLTISPPRDSLAIAYSYPSDRVRSNILLTARNRSQVVNTQRSHHGLRTGVLTPSANETSSSTQQAFSYAAWVTSPVATVPYVIYYARQFTERYELHVHFTSPRVPSKVWWFQGDDLHEAEKDCVRGRVLKPSPSNDYSHHFRGLDGDFCGIAWNW
ncbi:hypothetical protein [Streptomyces scabiei]|uniref:hypothetical protein n=1 Tax=Streptomyces scabiei TaxID=1930 RepID=UPI001B335A77|nr:MULTISPECIES: hypothetical protein [Streptomyces]MBP5895226.1 hypothetical protein [Streptomyces sp. LBUM 1481]MBP5925505.1 hypothetical protein [Streptomyces sp. LBUM 1483]MDX2684085.1 hypothetical protein [Streptomyces scabiei]MDX2748884.1 hypothetical protein [Streptomyces scabiei]MDX2803073.1 hypothetical protein [Streptomyces scabiei]